jgi:hypothetical protein
VIEAGISLQPLLEQYEQYSAWVTHSWLKPLWEKVVQLRVKLKALPLQLPQVKDKRIMCIFEAGNYRREELICLNRV